MASILNFAVLAFSESEKVGSPLDINPGVIIWTTVTFLLLLWVLKKTAWKPILNSLSERENFIKDSLEKAESAKKEAEELYKKNQENLARAEQESQKIIEQGREYAENLKKQILEESKLEAKKMIADASAEIERKNQEAFNNLKNQIAEIAVGAAEKIIKEKLDENTQKQLVSKYINEIAKS